MEPIAVEYKDLEGGHGQEAAWTSTAVTRTRSFVDGSTFTSKVISCMLIVGYLLNVIFPPIGDYFALIPDRTLPDVWNVVTAGFFEVQFVIMVADVVALMFLGRTIEPIWGHTEFVKFIAVVNLSVGCTTFFIMYFLYIVTRDTFYLMAKFGGFQGVIAGLLVAVRQLTPEEELIPEAPACLRFRAKYYLWIYLLATLLVCILSGAQHHHIGLYLFVLSGVYMSWLYLRYFQVTAAGVGDPADSFTFEKLFPDCLHPVMGRVAQAFHRIFCTPVQPTHVPAKVPTTPAVLGKGGANGEERPDASGQPANGKKAQMDPERRREVLERGSRMLEERMAASGIVLSPPKKDEPPSPEQED